MQVAIDVTPLAGPQTGIGIFVDELVHGLARLESEDLELIGLAMTARGRSAIAAALPPGIPLSKPAPARLLREAWSRVAFPPVEALTGGIDLVHGTNYVVPPALHAKTLVTIADLGAWHTPDVVHTSSLSYPGLVRRAIDRGAHVHAMSRYVAAEIESELGLEAERIHTVPIGLRPLVPGDRERGLALVSGRPYILAIGTIEPRKNFPLLVTALSELRNLHPDLQLVISGGEGWGIEELDAAIECHDLADRVLKLGFVDDASKADLLAGCEIVVSAAQYEGFGLVPLEAMTAGRPVVAVAGGSIPEICGDGAELVAIDDLMELASAIDRVLGDPGVQQDLISRGYKQAATFSWDRTAKDMFALYRHLLV